MASALTLVHATGELRKKIHTQLNENVNTKAQDLAAIKEWLRRQPHLPDEWEDCCLISFLRGSNFSLEKCKKKLDMYFTMRTACPEFFSNRDIYRPELQDLLSRIEGPTLPGLTPQGRRVTIIRALDKSLDTHHLDYAIMMGLMVGDIRIREEGLTEGVSGDVFVIDASILAPSHLPKISLSLLKKFIICIQEAYPVKVKEVHIINTTSLVDIVYSLMKPFLKEKIKKRIFFHNDASGLVNYIPVEMLPTDLGGHGESMASLMKAWRLKADEYIEWFKQQEHLKANESLRPGKPTDYDELFGIDGSFRKLEID